MGAILAKFRKEKTTTEVLEDLEERIQEIEKYSLNTRDQRNRFVGNFLAISIGFYVIAFIVFYFVYFPPTWRERIIYSVPLLLFPIVIFLLRRLFTWYFQRKLNKNSNKLIALRTEKKKILEQVMDKETYKVAVKLLARFADKTNGSKTPVVMTPRASNSNQPSSRLVLHSKALGVNNQSSLPSSLRNLTPLAPSTPRVVASVPQTAAAGSSAVRQLNFSPQARLGSNQELRRRTPFPILDQQGKGVFERIVDVLIGDGPQDRFAMICKECHAHNGMALKEDFEYTTFRCAFCNALNPSRKARPVAPRLSVHTQSTATLALPGITFSDSSDDTLSNSDDDSGSDRELTVRRQAPNIDLTGSSQTESQDLGDTIATANIVSVEATPSSKPDPVSNEGQVEEDTEEVPAEETPQERVPEEVRPKLPDELKKEM